jgi:hypothetical protein
MLAVETTSHGHSHGNTQHIRSTFDSLMKDRKQKSWRAGQKHHTGQNVQVVQRIAAKGHVAWLGHRLQDHAELVPDFESKLPKVRESTEHRIDCTAGEIPQACCKVVLLLACQ